MKKTISALIVLVLFLVSTVSVLALYENGIRNSEDTQEREETQERVMDFNESVSDEAERILERTETQERIESEVKGLENAYVSVDNYIAKQEIIRNMERFQERYQYRYELLNATNVGDETFIKAQNRIRFLFWDFDVEDQYIVDSDGKVVSEKVNFWSRFFGRTEGG